MRYVKEYEPSPEDKKLIQINHIVNICKGLYSLFHAVKVLVETKPYKTIGEYLDELYKSKEDLLAVKYCGYTSIKSDLEKSLEILFKNKDDYIEFMEFYNNVNEHGDFGPNVNKEKYTNIVYGNLLDYLCKIFKVKNDYLFSKFYNFIEDNDNLMLYDELTRTENNNIFNALKGYRICYDNGKNMYKTKKDLLQAVSVLYDFRFFIISEFEKRNYFEDNIDNIDFRRFVIDCLKYRPYGKHYLGSISSKAAVIFNLISKFKVYTDVGSAFKALKELD